MDSDSVGCLDALSPRAAEPGGARMPLWAHQRAMLRRCLDAEARGEAGPGVLRDGPGAGKTFVALALALADDPPAVTLAVVPHNLFGQWRDAAEAFAGEALDVRPLASYADVSVLYAPEKCEAAFGPGERPALVLATDSFYDSVRAVVRDMGVSLRRVVLDEIDTMSWFVKAGRIAGQHTWLMSASFDPAKAGAYSAAASSERLQLQPPPPPSYAVVWCDPEFVRSSVEALPEPEVLEVECHDAYLDALRPVVSRATMRAAHALNYAAALNYADLPASGGRAPRTSRQLVATLVAGTREDYARQVGHVDSRRCEVLRAHAKIRGLDSADFTSWLSEDEGTDNEEHVPRARAEAQAKAHFALRTYAHALRRHKRFAAGAARRMQALLASLRAHGLCAACLEPCPPTVGELAFLAPCCAPRWTWATPQLEPIADSDSDSDADSDADTDDDTPGNSGDPDNWAAYCLACATSAGPGAAACPVHGPDLGGGGGEWAPWPPVSENEKPGKQAAFVTLVDRIFLSPKNARLLVFSDENGALDDIAEHLRGRGIPCADLQGGTSARLDAAVAAFKSGAALALLVNTCMYGAGLNLECATDIVFMHHMRPTMAAQVVGRAQRPGRTCRLRVWQLAHRGELEDFQGA